MSPEEKRKRVLVADDEEDICLLLKKYLQRRNFDVMTVSDGRSALCVIEAERFDYFFLDCSMPDLTGLELIPSARSRNPQARIVLISGIPSLSADMLQRLGVDEFIYKPIRLSEVDLIVK